MDHDDLMAELTLEVPEGFEFTPDQADVIHSYHEGTNPVAVGAGAGTGKTTTLTRGVGEAILRECTPSPADCNANPFEDILVMTFMRDAANELKTTIKQVLRDHQAEIEGNLDQDLWRWAETGSHISTINSFTMELLREAAVDAHVDPGFDIRDELETQELLRDIRWELREDEAIADALDFLEDELDEWDDSEAITLIYNIQQKLREFGTDFTDLSEDLIDRFRGDLHQGYEPPLDPAAIDNIVNELSDDTTDPDDTDPDTVTAITDTYCHNLDYAKAVGDLVEAFDSVYDRLTRQRGLLTYTDVTYLVLQHLESTAGSELASSLRSRFSHIFVDEFQDTSYAQCRIISHLLPDETHGDDTEGIEGPKIMIIGDTKQAIYSWRSADPSIFADILEGAYPETEPDPYLEVQNWNIVDLTTNFRSHPHLVRAANGLFTDIFDHPGRGDISEFEVTYNNLDPARAGRQSSGDGGSATESESPHMHVLPLEESRANDWRNAEPRELAAIIRGIVDERALTVEDDGTERPMVPGDVTILFRASSRFREYREALDDYGIQNAVVAEKGLFTSEEVSFIIDVVDWFANPHSKDSLLRILRSPVTALEDRTLRFIASRGHDPTRALSDWDGDLSESDKERLATLVDLRSDLRWDREDAKANLIQKIIQHTGIETILLTGDDAQKRYGNLWMLVEVVRDWEDEELLPYRDFVDRLKQYREMADSGADQFEVAQVADDSADETVKLRTVHSAKGLEFKVVAIADLMQGEYASPISDDYIPVQDADGSRTIALHPREFGDSINFDPGPGSNWVSNGDTSTLWISRSRDTDGSLRHPHPYNSALANQFAEYWRLLYVAFTRAEDHLLLPLGDGYSWQKEWCWGAALLDHFQPENGWPDPADESLTGDYLQHGEIVRHEDDDGGPTIPITYGDLPQGEIRTPNPLGIDVLDDDLETGIEPDERNNDQQDTTTESETWEGIGFAPRRLRPSMLYDIIDCPRRFQYRTLQDITESHGESPPGTNNPPDMGPSEWGRQVHEVFEDFHYDLREGITGTSDSRVEARLDRVEDSVELPLREVLEIYQSETETWREVSNAETVLPEYQLSAQHPSEPNVLISGYVDLLYEVDGSWMIADYKTGDVPDDDADLFQQYKWQLATYVWMLQEEYDIEPEAARLVYVNSGIEKTLDLEWDLLSSFLQELPERLEIESEQGLPTNPRPDPQTQTDELDPISRCGACPYTEICPEWTNTG